MSFIGHHRFRRWLEVITNLHLKMLEKQLTDATNGKVAVYTMPLDCYLRHELKDALLDKLGVIIVDLTAVEIDKEILNEIRSSFEIIRGRDIRFVMLVSISKYTNYANSIKDFLKLCNQTIPLMPLKVATDSIAIGCDGGVIKSFRIISKDTIVDEPALLRIKQELEECECFLKVLESESLSAKREVFLQVINDLKFHLEAFGPAALAFCLDQFHNVIKDAEEVEREVSLHCLLKFLKTKQIVMDSLFKEYFEQKKQIRLVHSCLEMALRTLENEVNMVSSSQKVTLRFALLVDSNATARVLFSTLQELKMTTRFNYLKRFSIYLIDTTFCVTITPLENTLIITTIDHYSILRHNFQLNICICIGIPKDYEDFLKIKRLLIWKEGTLHFMLSSTNANFAASMKVILSLLSDIW